MNMCLPLYIDNAGIKKTFAYYKARIKADLGRASKAVSKTLPNNYD